MDMYKCTLFALIGGFHITDISSSSLYIYKIWALPKQKGQLLWRLLLMAMKQV